MNTSQASAHFGPENRIIYQQVNDPRALGHRQLADAVEKMEDWRRYYNEDCPHSAIEYNVPIALQNPGGETSPPS